jgi:hypothetical protein
MLPLIWVTATPVSATVPVEVTAKSLAVTPVTFSEKVTVNDSLLLWFGLVPVRLIEVTAGVAEETLE